MTTADERSSRLEQAIRLKRAAARSRGPELPARPPKAPAYLGEMQKSLWLIHRLDPLSPAYNLSNAFRVRGLLDVSELRRALNEVAARHRLLRSTFRAQRGAVVQQIDTEARLDVGVVEASAGGAVAAAAEEARRPFDLATGPLLRMLLVEEPADGERLLLLALHHILADERSLELLWSELADAYRRRLPLDPPRVQYDDWVHSTRRQRRERSRRDLDYWRRRLEPLPEELRLPFERPVRAAAGARGRLLARLSTPAVRQGVRRLAAAAGVTPFAVFAFSFRLLLERYTAGRRVSFATPASIRSHPATAKMIGYFLNPVVICGRIDEALPVGRAVGAFGREVRQSLGRGAVPFHRLTEELSPPRRPDRHPIFQAMFVHQESGPPPELGDARLEPVALDLGESKFDLTLFVDERESSLGIAVEYRADRFEAVWMERLLDHYATLLERLPEDLERATAAVAMVGEREQRRLRAAARGAEPHPSSPELLPRRILDASRRSPRSPAVLFDGLRWSYGELAAAARAIACGLRAGGVAPNDRVGLFVARSPWMIAAILGSHRAGAAYVPLDPDYPPARNRDVLEDAQVRAVLTTSELAARLPAGGWSTIDVERLEAGEESGAEPDPGSVAYLLYTSGSTGRPKGVVVTHGNLKASNDARLQHYERLPGRFLLVPSIAFDSSVAGIFWTLSTGGSLVIPSEEEARDARRLTRLVAEAGVSWLLCVPSLYAQMLALGADRLAGLEAAIVAGESCPPRLVAEHRRMLPRVRLFNEYGPTEATVWATGGELTEADAAGPVSIGRPIPGVRLRVVDALGRPVPAGVPGEAWIEGATVARGYWRRPQPTAERFAVDPATGARCYRTGDRMTWSADDRLLFLGRTDEQIKLRGLRVEPGEIEAALLELPGIKEAAVVARPAGSGAAAGAGSDGDALVAFVVGAAAEAGWRRELSRRLPDPMLPSRLVELPRMPRLPNGKIDRRCLRAMPLPKVAEAAADASPPSVREQALLSLWQGLLGIDGIGVDDNFFELGGHSLLAVEMAVAIERDFAVSLSATEVFEQPTVRQLARRIDQRAGSAAPAYRQLFAIQPTGRGMPFIVALPHFFTEMLASRFRGERPVYGLRGIGLRPEGNLGRWRTLRELAEELVEEIGRRFAGETCILAGYSFGASMAFEATRLMEKRGMAVRRLYLIAPMPLDIYRLGPLRLQLDGLRQPVAELSTTTALGMWARSNNPLTPGLYRRARRRLVIEPWRRLLQLAGRLRLAAGLPLTQRILYADVRVDRFRLHARYRPQAVRTPTVFFNAREPETDAAATWRPCFRGPLTVVETPDPHLDGASVEAARDVILGHLEELGDESC